MGYRVGNECFADYQQALDFKIAHIVPVISNNGVLLSPVKHDGNWYVGETQVRIDFPECSASDDFLFGLQISSAILSLFITAFLMRFLINFIRNLGNDSVSASDSGE